MRTFDGLGHPTGCVGAIWYGTEAEWPGRGERAAFVGTDPGADATQKLLAEVESGVVARVWVCEWFSAWSWLDALLAVTTVPVTVGREWGDLAAFSTVRSRLSRPVVVVARPPPVSPDLLVDGDWVSVGVPYDAWYARLGGARTRPADYAGDHE